MDEYAMTRWNGYGLNRAEGSLVELEYLYSMLIITTMTTRHTQDSHTPSLPFSISTTLSQQSGSLQGVNSHVGERKAV